MAAETPEVSVPPRTSLLAGRAVLVTGAGGGVGEGIALACAAHGANVVIAARRTETGDPVADEIRRRGGRAVSVRCDVAAARLQTQRFHDALAQFGKSATGEIELQRFRIAEVSGEPRSGWHQTRYSRTSSHTKPPPTWARAEYVSTRSESTASVTEST